MKVDCVCCGKHMGNILEGSVLRTGFGAICIVCQEKIKKLQSDADAAARNKAANPFGDIFGDIFGKSG